MSEQTPEVIDPNSLPSAVQQQPAQPEKSNKEKVGDSFTSVFMDRLKEQSFTILLMLAVVYYQHTLWQQDKAALEKEVDVKEERILQVVERERDKGIEREKILEAKLDQFVELLKQQAAYHQAQVK